jgi:hypothetical protein
MTILHFEHIAYNGTKWPFSIVLEYAGIDRCHIASLLPLASKVYIDAPEPRYNAGKGIFWAYICKFAKGQLLIKNCERLPPENFPLPDSHRYQQKKTDHPLHRILSLLKLFALSDRFQSSV